MAAACTCGLNSLPHDWLDVREPLTVDELRTCTAYLRAGMLESYEHGYSHCRFRTCAGAGKSMGCATLTDGVWVWPEGLPHYVEAHDVHLPLDFVSHIFAESAREGRSSGGARCVTQRWNPETRGGEPIPGETLAWLSQHSTLQVR